MFQSKFIYELKPLIIFIIGFLTIINIENKFAIVLGILLILISMLIFKLRKDYRKK